MLQNFPRSRPHFCMISEWLKWSFTFEKHLKWSYVHVFLPNEGEEKTGTSCALDCGAGIGRITKRLLLPLFNTVDLVDVTQEFLDKAKTYLGNEGKRVGNFFCTGLQDFVPESGRYDVIWIQWVIGK